MFKIPKNLFWFLVFISIGSFAQNQTVRVEINPLEVSIDGQISIHVFIIGNQYEVGEFPDIKGFKKGNKSIKHAKVVFNKKKEDQHQVSQNYIEKNLDNNEVIGIYYQEGMDIEAQILSQDLSYTYSVSFIPSDIPWSSRWDTYLYREKGEVHWLSIINSFAMVIFL